MDTQETTRRNLLKMAGLGTAASLASGIRAGGSSEPDRQYVDEDFFIRPEELTLRFHHSGAERRLSFAKFKGTPETWRETCRRKLADLLGFVDPAPRPTRLIRSIEHEGVHIEARVMQVSSSVHPSPLSSTDWANAFNFDIS